MVVKVHGGVFDNQVLQGNLRYFDIEETNLTVNTLADAGAQLGEVVILIPGTGHNDGDVLTFVGGAGATDAELTIRNPGGVGGAGEILQASITDVGAYTSIPTNPITVTTTGSGTPLAGLLEVNFWASSIIIVGAGTQAGQEYFVPYLDAVVGSAVDQVLAEVATYATIVQVAIVDANTVRVVLENDSMAWDQPGGGDAEADMQTAIQALGTVDVPDTTDTGTTFNLAAATVAERTLDGFAVL
jgi:hypothetical protein